MSRKNLLSLFFALFTFVVFADSPQFVQVAGISSPSAANGIYEKQGSTHGVMNHNYWKHVSAEYYLYSDSYSDGMNVSYFWNIDNNLNDEIGRASCRERV